MKPILLLPVAVLAFGLGIVVDRGLTSAKTSESSGSDSQAESQPTGRGSILDPAPSPATPGGQANETSRPAPANVGRGGAITIDELLSMSSSPGGAQRMSSMVEIYQRLAGMGASSLEGLAKELEDNFQPQGYMARQQVFSAWTEADPEAAWEFAKKSKNQQSKQQLYSLVFAHVAAEDPAKAKAMLAEVKNPQLRAMSLQGFMSTEMIESDPQAVIAMVKEAGGQAQWQYHSLFSNWASRDPIAASKALEGLDAQAQMNAANGIASAWSMEDPDAAMEWSLKLKNRQARQNAISAVMQSLTYRDPQKAIALYEKLPKGANQQQVLQSIAQGYLQNDQEAAIEWIESLDRSDRGKALSGSLYQLAHTDPEKAAELFESSSMNSQMSHQASQIATSMANKSPERAKEWIDGLPAGQAKTNAISGLLQSWGQNDPKGAAAYLDEVGLTQRNSHMAGNMVSQWVLEDKEAAVDWVLSQENSSVQQNLVSNMVSQWASHEPQEALSFVDTLEDESMKASATQTVLNSMAHQDPDAALEWIQGQGGDAQPKYMASLISGMAHNDTERAIEIFNDYLPSLTEEQASGEFSSATSSIASSWGQYEPEAAGDWALTLPEGNARNQAVSNIARNWLRNDSMAASEWIGELPAGQLRDQAVEPLIRTIQEDDPDAAFAWALSISEERLRQRSLQNVVGRWNSSDPDAAAAAVRSADLTEEQANQLIPPR